MRHTKNIYFKPIVFQNFLTTICLMTVVFSFSLIVESAFATTQLSTPPLHHEKSARDHYELVIVTTTELLPEFSRLADWRSSRGTSATVVTTEWILDEVEHGDDLQETIRNFLILAQDQWQTDYVLLGGNWELLPPRYIRSYVHLYPDIDYVDLPSDLYFGCLDGTWDADGDGVFGEFSEDGDNPDLLPELGVGRAPVGTPEETVVFVDKILAHDRTLDFGYINRALLLAEVIVPYDWQPGQMAFTDGGNFIENYIPIFDDALPPLQPTRLYENYSAFPNAEPLTHEAVIDSLASGHFNLVYQMGVGSFDAWSLGGFPVNQQLTLSDIPALTNAPNYFTIMSLTGYTPNISSVTLIEEMIRSPLGGAVAGIGKTELAYLSQSLSYSEFLLQHLLDNDSPVLGLAHKQALEDLAPSAATNSMFHLIVMETVLFGDPTMRFRETQASSVPGAELISHQNISLGPCSPNPFNPSTRISYFIPEISHVKLSIFDTRGLLIDQLVNQEMEAGEHLVPWNGTDTRGNNVPSGVYFYRIETNDYSEAKSMVLIR